METAFLTKPDPTHARCLSCCVWPRMLRLCVTFAVIVLGVAYAISPAPWPTQVSRSRSMRDIIIIRPTNGVK